MVSDATNHEGLRDRLRARRGDLLAAAARRGASNLRVFGSVARGDDSAQSDVDFLVDFEASRSLVDVAGLILDLQEILGVPVDVVEASTLRPSDEDILADAVALETA
jgi:predicted nucleotidyltransferase